MGRTTTARAIAAALLVGVLATTTTSLAGAAPYQSSETSTFVDLVDQLDAADARLRDLVSEIAGKREAANKAFVDLDVANANATTADRALAAARDGLNDAVEQISAAQQKFNQYAATAYTKGNPAASVAAYVGGTNPSEMLDRAQFGQLIAAQQRQVLDRLNQARSEQESKVDQAQDAKVAADQAAADAQNRKNDADQAIVVAATAADAQSGLRAQLLAQKEQAAKLLEALRPKVSADNPIVAKYDATEATSADTKSRIKKLMSSFTALGFGAVGALSEDENTKSAATTIAQEQKAAALKVDEPAAAVDTEGAEGLVEGMGGSAEAAGNPGSLEAPAVRGSAAVEVVVNRALSQIGVPYAWGGGNAKGPTKGIRDGGVADSYGDYKKVGFDCSGLMIYAFAGVGIELDHYSGYQYTAGTQVPVKSAKRGDMLFWGGGGSQHVALYLGEGLMVEAPESGSYVQVSEVRWGGIQPYATRLID